MAKRYVPRSPFAVRDKRGVRLVFNPDRRGPDGSLGYTEDELAHLYKEHRKGFAVQEVFGSDIVEDDEVEQATAAPGEKRSVKKSSDDE